MQEILETDSSDNSDTPPFILKVPKIVCFPVFLVFPTPVGIVGIVGLSFLLEVILSTEDISTPFLLSQVEERLYGYAVSARFYAREVFLVRQGDHNVKLGNERKYNASILKITKNKIFCNVEFENIEISTIFA